MNEILVCLMVASMAFCAVLSCLADQPPREDRQDKAAPSTKKQPYAYAVVDGGYEITNGPGIGNRPLYGTHCRDEAAGQLKLLALVGDRPDALLILTSGEDPYKQMKVGHLLLGIKGGKWFNAFETIKARYVPGHQDYELRDPSIPGSIALSYVRPVDFEGLLVRVRLGKGWDGELAFGCGGVTTKAEGGIYDYQDNERRLFKPDECRGSQVKIEGQSFSIRKGESVRTLSGAASTPVRLSLASADALAEGPDSLLGSKAKDCPVIAGSCTPTAEGEVYLVLTTDEIGLPEVKAYLRDPAGEFEKCCRHWEELSRTMEIDTPDPYLNLGVRSQVLAMDATWQAPSFTHGTWTWHMPYAGFRILYGPSAMGWHDRVSSHVREFMKIQLKSPEYPTPEKIDTGVAGGAYCRGAIPALLGTPHVFYDMGEVLMDMALYDWLWAGDKDFAAEVFDFISDGLLWEQRCLDSDENGLYENWLNIWGSDYIWYNGGDCIQASVYNWKANLIMADIAKRLGKDATVFEQRTARIEKACKDSLWVSDRGLYAEYKDTLGLRRLHEAPQLASIYLPIDLGLCDQFQAYQMLRYSEYAIRNDQAKVPRGGRLAWSTNWLPPIWTSCGLYQAENIHLMLCYYKLGLAEKADDLMRGMDATFFMGPCPGGNAIIYRQDGSQANTTDFTDTTSMFLRSIAEGLFGVRMNAPDGHVTVQPSLPRDWKKASIKLPAIAYEYDWDGGLTERVHVKTAQPLSCTLRLMARQGKVKSVQVNGQAASFHIEPGIGSAWIVVDVALGQEASIEVAYEASELPKAKFSPLGAIGLPYLVTAQGGKIVEIKDPQSILEGAGIDNGAAKTRLKDRPGWHTFFVLLEKDQVRLWQPVDVELRQPVEIVHTRLDIDGDGVRYACALRNNTTAEMKLQARLGMAGSRQSLEISVPALGESVVIVGKIGDPSLLSPGTNRVTAAIAGDFQGDIQADLVNWKLARKLPAVAEMLKTARTISLVGLVNQELATLHEQKYLNPRPKTYSMTVTASGRPWWEKLQKGKEASPDLEGFKIVDGRFNSGIAVPFAVPSDGPNACFTSIYENFPRKIEVPVKAKGRKIYFLLAASTNPMQSRIENARLTVNVEGRQEVIPLTNPENLDDWLNSGLNAPYALSGFVQDFGKNTHGLILDLDLGQSKQIDSVSLECLSNEALVGLVGLTVLP